MTQINQSDELITLKGQKSYLAMLFYFLGNLYSIFKAKNQVPHIYELYSDILNSEKKEHWTCVSTTLRCVPKGHRVYRHPCSIKLKLHILYWPCSGPSKVDVYFNGRSPLSKEKGKQKQWKKEFAKWTTH